MGRTIDRKGVLFSQAYLVARQFVGVAFARTAATTGRFPI